MLMKISLRKHEHALQFRTGNVVRVVEPVGYWRASLLGALLGRDRFHPDADEPADNPARITADDGSPVIDESTFTAALTVVEVRAAQRALVTRDERLIWVLAPGRHAFWRVPLGLDVRTRDLNPSITTTTSHQPWTGHLVLEGVHVAPGERIDLHRQDKVVDSLTPGVHSYWRATGELLWRAGSLRPTSAPRHTPSATCSLTTM